MGLAKEPKLLVRMFADSLPKRARKLCSSSTATTRAHDNKLTSDKKKAARAERQNLEFEAHQEGANAANAAATNHHKHQQEEAKFSLPLTNCSTPSTWQQRENVLFHSSKSILTQQSSRRGVSVFLREKTNAKKANVQRQLTANNGQ